MTYCFKKGLKKLHRDFRHSRNLREILLNEVGDPKSTQFHRRRRHLSTPFAFERRI